MEKDFLGGNLVKWEEKVFSENEANHHSRVSNIGLFCLPIVFVTGQMSLDQIGVLPYFQLSQPHVSLLLHNLLPVVGRALESRWLMHENTPEWFVRNCPNVRVWRKRSVGGVFDVGGFVFKESEAVSHGLDDDSELKGKTFDLTLIADGSDVECGSSVDRTTAQMLNGIKTQRLVHKAIRFVVFTNIYGWVVGYSTATAAFPEIGMLIDSKFLSDLNDAFSSWNRPAEVLLRLDRGYFAFDSKPELLQKLGEQYPHLKIMINKPHSPHKAFKPGTKTKDKWYGPDEALDNINRTQIRSQVERTNHDFKEYGFFRREIPVSLMSSLDHASKIAFSLANYHKGKAVPDYAE
jgi:hypothetical protein